MEHARKCPVPSCCSSCPTWISLLLVPLLLHVVPVPLAACTCDPVRLACEEYSLADAVFVGSPTRGPLQWLGKLFGRTSLQVSETFKGALGKEVELKTSVAFGFPGDCRAYFAGGETYLIYAYEVDGSLQATFCGRTRPLRGAGNDDLDGRKLNEELAFLRQAKAGIVDTEIFGFVTKKSYNRKLWLSREEGGVS